MLLVLIGPYFNHSHWSVSSLDGTYPLSLSRSFFLSVFLCPAALVHPLIPSLTRSLSRTLSLDTYTSVDTNKLADTLPRSVCLTHPVTLRGRRFIHPLIHSVSHSTTSLARPPSLSSILPLHPYLSHVLLSFSTSSLPLSLIPVEHENHQAGEGLMFPLYTVCGVICSMQHAAAGVCSIMCFYCMAVSSNSKTCCCSCGHRCCRGPGTQ